MKKKIVFMAVAALAAGMVMARPGPGGFHGGFGGPRFHHGGFGGPRHFGGYGYHGGYHHRHHHYSGWGWGLGAAGLALGTAAVVRDIVAPRTVVYSSPAVYPAYPATYVAPTVYSTPVYSAPVVYPAATYMPPPPPPPPPRW